MEQHLQLRNHRSHTTSTREPISARPNLLVSVAVVRGAPRSALLRTMPCLQRALGANSSRCRVTLPEPRRKATRLCQIRCTYLTRTYSIVHTASATIQTSRYQRTETVLAHSVRIIVLRKPQKAREPKLYANSSACKPSFARRLMPDCFNCKPLGTALASPRRRAPRTRLVLIRCASSFHQLPPRDVLKHGEASIRNTRCLPKLSRRLLSTQNSAHRPAC